MQELQRVQKYLVIIVNFTLYAPNLKGPSVRLMTISSHLHSKVQYLTIKNNKQGYIV